MLWRQDHRGVEALNDESYEWLSTNPRTIQQNGPDLWEGKGYSKQLALCLKWWTMEWGSWELLCPVARHGRVYCRQDDHRYRH